MYIPPFFCVQSCIAWQTFSPLYFILMYSFFKFYLKLSFCNQGTSYSIDRSLGNCTIHPIQLGSFATQQDKTALMKNGAYVIKMKGPLDIFSMNESYRWAGQVRILQCLNWKWFQVNQDHWSLTLRIFLSPCFLLENCARNALRRLWGYDNWFQGSIHNPDFHKRSPILFHVGKWQ